MLKKIYHKKRDKFAREIYGYCDENIERKVLFPVFMNLYSERGRKNRTELSEYTSDVIKYLIQEKIIKEIKKQEVFCVPYGLYEILNHRSLIKEEFAFKKYNFDFTRKLLV